MQLQVLLSCERGRIIAIGEGSHVIGRGGSVQVTLLSEIVSRAHARLEVGSSTLLIVDLASVNGTFLDGVRVDGEALASPGAVILVGDVALRVHAAGADVPPLHPRDAGPARLGILPDVAGSLVACPASTLLRYLAVRKKSGVLTLTSPEREARFLFVRGEMFGLSGPADPAETLAWQGSYELAPPIDAAPSVRHSIDALLGARRDY